MFSSQSIDMFFYNLLFYYGFTIDKKNIILLLFLSLNKNKKQTGCKENLASFVSMENWVLECHFWYWEVLFVAVPFFKGHLVDS